MDVGKTKIILLIQFSLVLFGLPTIVSANTDCLGKAFHCVNVTHFQICVDLGGGISTTVDDFLIQCPQGTGCLGTNHFECEFLPPTTPTEIIQTSEVTNEIEWISNASSTTVVPQKNVSEVEHSENLKSTAAGTNIEGTTHIITTGTTALNDVLASVDFKTFTTIAPERVSSVQQSEVDQTTVTSDTTDNDFAGTDVIDFYATTKSSDLQEDTVRSTIIISPPDYDTNVPITVSNSIQDPSVTEAINSDVTNINAEFKIFSTTVSNGLQDPVTSETMKSDISNLYTDPGVNYPSTINVSNDFETVTEITDSRVDSNIIFKTTTTNDLQTNTPQNSIIITNVDSNSTNLTTNSNDLQEPSAADPVIIDTNINTDLNTIFTTTIYNDLQTDSTFKNDIMNINVDPNPKIIESEKKYGINTNDNFKTSPYDLLNPSVTETLTTDETNINSDFSFSTTVPANIETDVTPISDIMNSNVDSNNVYTTSKIRDYQYTTAAETVSDIVNPNNDFKTTSSYNFLNPTTTETLTSVDLNINVDANMIFSTTISNNIQTDHTRKGDILGSNNIDLTSMNNDRQNPTTTETVLPDIKNDDFKTTIYYDSFNPSITETISVDANVNEDLNSIVSTTISNDMQTDATKSDILHSDDTYLTSMNNDAQDTTTTQTTISYDFLVPSASKIIGVDTYVNVDSNSVVSTTISNDMPMDNTPISDIIDSNNFYITSMNNDWQNPTTTETLITNIEIQNNDYKTTISSDSLVPSASKTISVDTNVNVDSNSIVSTTIPYDMQTDSTPESDILHSNNTYLTPLKNDWQNLATTETLITNVEIKKNDYKTTISDESLVPFASKTISVDTNVNVDENVIISTMTPNYVQTNTTSENILDFEIVNSDIAAANNGLKTTISYDSQNQSVTETVRSNLANMNTDLNKLFTSMISNDLQTETTLLKEEIKHTNAGIFSTSIHNYLETTTDTKTEKNVSFKTTNSYDSLSSSVTEKIRSDDTNMNLDSNIIFSTMVPTDLQKNAISMSDILNPNSTMSDIGNKIANETMISDITNKNIDLFNVDRTTVSSNLQSPSVDEIVPIEITSMKADSSNKYSTILSNSVQTDTTNDAANTSRDSLAMSSIVSDSMTATTSLNGSDFKQGTKETSFTKIITELRSTETNVYDSLNKNIDSIVIDAELKKKDLEGRATTFPGKFVSKDNLDETTSHFPLLNSDTSNKKTENGEVNTGKNEITLTNVEPSSNQLFLSNNKKGTTFSFENMLVRTTESIVSSNINDVTLDNSDKNLPIVDVMTSPTKTSSDTTTSSHKIDDVTAVAQEVGPALKSNNVVSIDISEKSFYNPLTKVAKQAIITELPDEITMSSVSVTNEAHTVDNVTPLDNLKIHDVNQYLTTDTNTSEINSKDILTNVKNTTLEYNNVEYKEVPFDSTTYGYAEWDVRTTDKSVLEISSLNSNIASSGTSKTIGSNNKINLFPSTEDNYQSLSEKSFLDKSIQLGNVAIIDSESQTSITASDSQDKSRVKDVHVSSYTVPTISHVNINNNLLLSENNEGTQKIVSTNTIKNNGEEQSSPIDLKKLNSVNSVLGNVNLKFIELPKIKNSSQIADLISTEDSSVLNVDPKPTVLAPSLLDINFINAHENIENNKTSKLFDVPRNQTTIDQVITSYDIKGLRTNTTKNISEENKTKKSSPLEPLIFNETSQNDSTNVNIKHLNVEQNSKTTAEQNTTKKELSNVAKDPSLLRYIPMRPGDTKISGVTETTSTYDNNLIKYFVINPDSSIVLKNIESAQTISQTLIAPAKSVSSDLNINKESTVTEKTTQFGSSVTNNSNKTMESNLKFKLNTNQSKVMPQNPSETNNTKQHEGLQVGTAKNVQRISLDSASSITGTVTEANMNNGTKMSLFKTSMESPLLVKQKSQSKKSDSSSSNAALTDSSTVVKNSQNQKILPSTQRTLHSSDSIINTSTSDKASLKLNRTNIKNQQDLVSFSTTKTSFDLQQNETNIANAFDCKSHPRGRYADMHDCRKFYICIGRNQRSIVGSCPMNTVFDSIKKQCTKNLSHCVRNNQFQCSSAGRFNDLIENNVYYICIQNKLNAYVKFKFQCQKGFVLDINTVKCITRTNTNDSRNRSEQVSTSDNNSKKAADQSARDSKSERSVSISREKIDFECEKEGKFADPNDCRRYFVCKQKDSEFRRKRRKCDSDELFNKNKKKCVDAESYECDL